MCNWLHANVVRLSFYQKQHQVNIYINMTKTICFAQPEDNENAYETEENW
jgi:hypothetical protein